jgi:hypothetical protein
MATNLNIRVNTVDATVPYATTPADYITLDLVNDKLIWSAGSGAVFTNCGYIPTGSQLDGAASLISVSPLIVQHCFIADQSANNIFDIVGTHGENVRYVFAFSFDNATATEPQLEAWDTNAHSSANLQVLGAGVNNNSMFHAVCTTASTPGSNWTGVSLAGSNVVLLNAGGGALGGAADLYANIYIKIPANYATPESSTPVLTVRYTYS